MEDEETSAGENGGREGGGNGGSGNVTVTSPARPQRAAKAKARAAEDFDDFEVEAAATVSALLGRDLTKRFSIHSTHVRRDF
jgi:hypothetical protein